MPPPLPLPPRLLHHLPLGRTTYHHASKIQDHLVSLHLQHKKLLSLAHHNSSTSSFPSPPPPPPPPPTIITSEFHPPVYTTGRRHLHALPPDINPTTLTTTPHPRTGELAEFITTLRGGQTTWHGPGQATVYVVGDLAGGQLAPPSPSPSHTSTTTTIGIKSWVALLEQTTINTIKTYLPPRTTSTSPPPLLEISTDPAYPGVWISRTRKIAALGVHARRHVVAHGVGLNVATDPWWWGRIVPCGIVGRGVTSLREEMERLQEGGVEGGQWEGEGEVPSVDEVGRRWVSEMAGALGREVKVVTEEEVMMMGMSMGGYGMGGGGDGGGGEI
ncbi:hypothetical protein DFH27DRAFT_622446 [Peziza echinospora]|nr:hypothetical protein DFH27DRAFT_622446 [Peziza echinospora]